MVKLATERATGGEYAVKIMSLPDVGRSVGDNENTRDDIFKEIDILVGLNHPNVIYLKEYFEENNKVLRRLVFQQLPHMHLWHHQNTGLGTAAAWLVYAAATSANIPGDCGWVA